MRARAKCSGRLRAVVVCASLNFGNMASCVRTPIPDGSGAHDVPFLQYTDSAGAYVRSMKLGYVIIYVQDVTRSVDFYERAFGVKRRFVHESGTYAEMETGNVALAFAHEDSTPTRELFAQNRADAKPPGVEVAFVTEDVHAAFDTAVAAGAAAVLAPGAKPWGQIVSYVRDLNGFLVELCSPMGD